MNIDMRLSSVNIARERPIEHAKPSGKTGIFKRPVATPVRVSSTGLEGDAVCDTENHGGVDQAVYLYGTPDYAWWSAELWSAELGLELSPGTFGENLTISGLESARVAIGERFHLGEVILEATAPRVPCVTLAARMNDPTFVKRFRAAERPGLYCRVIREGCVQVGDAVKVQRFPGELVTALELFRAFYDPHPGEATLRRHLGAPLAVRARLEKEEQLRKVMAQQQTRTRSELA